MEDVLALYAMPYDARYPTVCRDEKPVVLHADVRPALPLAPGHVECRDYEYQRHGTANLFVMVEPLAGWRHVSITERRTKQDYTEVLRYLVEERYPDAECICSVQDNLNTHTAGALYETFSPQQARRILTRLGFHYTPKRGSWLNQAKIEISIFERGCLSRGPYRTPRPCSNAYEPWRRSATHAAPPSTGSSPPATPVPSSRTSTQFSRVRWMSDIARWKQQDPRARPG
jgi:hypothetical protein